MLYFDHAASTPIHNIGLQILNDSLQNDFANPAAAHAMGKALGKVVEISRERILNCARAKDYQFFFTSSATESNNMILKGIALPQGSIALVSHADHPSIWRPIESRGDVIVKEIPLKVNGHIDYEALSNMVDGNVSLLAIAHVNNTSGNCHDVDHIGSILKSKSPKAHLHVDGVQAFARVPMYFEEGSFVDSYSVSGHKIGAPKGIAGIFVRKGIEFKPLLEGGGQEFGMRSSTLAFPLIKTFARVVEDDFVDIVDKYKTLEGYSEKIIASLQEQIPSLVFPFTGTAHHIVSFAVPGISSDILMRQLERMEVYVSSSSACSAKIKTAPPVFDYLHVDPKLQKSMIRVSLSSKQTEEEIDEFIAKFVEVYRRVEHLIK